MGQSRDMKGEISLLYTGWSKKTMFSLLSVRQVKVRDMYSLLICNKEDGGAFLIK